MVPYSELPFDIAGVNTDGLITDFEFERRIIFEQEPMDFEAEQFFFTAGGWHPEDFFQKHFRQ
jgi:hypothetical protein